MGTLTEEVSHLVSKQIQWDNIDIFIKTKKKFDSMKTSYLFFINQYLLDNVDNNMFLILFDVTNRSA